MDTFDLLRNERMRLADELAELTDDEWRKPSLCDGWTTHVVAAHLNMPWAVSSPQFILGLVKALGNIDRTMDRFSRDLALRMSPAECVAGLREHADNRFTPPTLGPDAPLTDVVMHGADILHPLGRRVTVDPEAMSVVLDFVTASKGKGSSNRNTDGVWIHVTDLDVHLGDGEAEVSGPALAVCGALLHREPFVDELDGPGVAVLRAQS
jgi:uncharacterized protein (TIGR03083 family)